MEKDRKNFEGEIFEDLTEEAKYEKIIRSIKENTLIASGMDPRVEETKKSKGKPRRRNRNKNPVEWWDADCRKAIKDRNTARKAYEKIRNLATKINYKRSIAVARRVVNEKKKENFRKFASSLNRFTDVSYVWKKMNTFKNRDNKQTWGREGDKEYDRIVSLEMEKVAPPWTEETPMCLDEQNKRS